MKCIDYKNKLKSVANSQVKIINFDELCNRFIGDDYQKGSDKYVFRSINHDMYLQKVTKNFISDFDEKRYFLNEIESILSIS